MQVRADLLPCTFLYVYTLKILIDSIKITTNIGHKFLALFQYRLIISSLLADIAVYDNGGTNNRHNNNSCNTI